MKISESIVYVISQLIGWGQENNSGSRQNISKSFAESFDETFYENFVSS